jgi:glycosyltransferase involved in cell wall biosynthesis
MNVFNESLPAALSPVLNIDNHAARCGRLRILVLRLRVLVPRHSPEHTAMLRLTEELCRENDVTLLTFSLAGSHEADDAELLCLEKQGARVIAPPYKKSPCNHYKFLANACICLLGSRHFSPDHFARSEMARILGEVHAEINPDLVICDQPGALGVLGRSLVPFVLFQHNLRASAIEQMARGSSSLWARACLAMQARQMRRAEQAQLARAGHIVAINEQGREMAARRGAQNCDVLPAAVDTRHYQPAPHPCPVNNLAFAGDMSHPAIRESMCHFITNIFPQIRAEVPNTGMCIVGPNPSAEMLQLGRSHGIAVIDSPEDIRPHLHSAKVFVAPLLKPAGSSVRLLEALAMGKAVICTPEGAEGVLFEKNRDMLIESEPQKFADAIVSLLRNSQRRQLLEVNARKLAVQYYSWHVIGRVFNELCCQVALNG